jgi:hypothetical protein
MIATQQVGEKMTWGLLDKERLTVVFDLQKAMGASYAKLLRLMPKALLLKTWHRTYHRVHYGSKT